MIVLHKNHLYDLDMPFLLYQSFKKSSPDVEVKLIQRTTSTYKKQLSVALREVEDYSIARNLQALTN